MITETTAVNAREAAIDAKLADLWAMKNAHWSKIDSAKVGLAREVGIRPQYGRGYRKPTVNLTLDEIMVKVNAMLAGEMRPWDRKSVEEKVAAVAAAREAIAKLNEQAAPLEALFEAEQWNRFFLVTNADGHIHRSMHCSTCRMTTGFAWLPALSGLTEADAVAAHGPHLCTVCFPTAPVEWTRGEEKPVDPDRCAGSGTYHDSSGLNYYSPRARCNHCRKTVSVTSTGKIRNHKTT